MKLVISMFRAYRFFITTCIVGILSFLFGFCVSSNGQIIETKYDTVHFPIVEEKIENFDHESTYEQLIENVDSHINKYTKGKHDLTLAKAIVDNALEYDIDIVFMLSQTHIETLYGTGGIGKASSKRSLFGVMKRKYESYDAAVKDYCKILKKSYLVNGKTEHDLMRKYVTKGGYRYASNPNYEKELKALYVKISKNTELLELQNRYKAEYKEYLASLTNTNKIYNDTTET